MINANMIYGTTRTGSVRNSPDRFQCSFLCLTAYMMLGIRPSMYSWAVTAVTGNMKSSASPVNNMDINKHRYKNICKGNNFKL
jgi:hypothetical protein